MRSTNENFDVFNSQDEIYLVFTKQSKFSFYFILFLEDLKFINLLTMLQAELQYICNVKEDKGVFFCLFVLLLYVPSQQLWSLRDGQFT